jgi:hypothetical protein
MTNPANPDSDKKESDKKKTQKKISSKYNIIQKFVLSLQRLNLSTIYGNFY